MIHMSIVIPKLTMSYGLPKFLLSFLEATFKTVRVLYRKIGGGGGGLFVNLHVIGGETL